MRRAKIIATIGPASQSMERLKALIEAGMDVARLNFSHGEPADHARTIQLLRQASEDTGRPIAILQDLQGPRLRTGDVPENEPIRLQAGAHLTLSTKPVAASAERIFINYPFLTQDVSVGDRILLDDGRLELQVEAVGEDEVLTTVRTGGPLGAHKGINIPGVRLSAPPLTDKDRRDLAFGVEHGVDLIAMSFVRHEDHVTALKEALTELDLDGPPIPIIAKLERQEAVERLHSILEIADGVMVARGDLGVEVSPERVPSLQKHIISSANHVHKTVITATQMLESMIHSPRPTRAEASDVANAIFDGSDALMLSGETAIGNYPVESLATMARIMDDAEEHAREWGFQPMEGPEHLDDDAAATTHAATTLADDRGARLIAVFTRSGRTAQLMSTARPSIPILGFTPEPKTFRRMSLYWGVEPRLCPMAYTVEEMIGHVEDDLLKTGAFEPGHRFVLVASLPVGAMGPANMTYLHTLGDTKAGL